MRRQRQLSPEALVALQSKEWPGNIRELKSVLQRSVILSGEKEVLHPEDLQFESATENESQEVPAEPHEGFDLSHHLAETRSRYIERALQLTGHNQSRAAKLLGLSPQAISNFLKGKGQAAQ